MIFVINITFMILINNYNVIGGFLIMHEVDQIKKLAEILNEDMSPQDKQVAADVAQDIEQDTDFVFSPDEENVLQKVQNAENLSHSEKMVLAKLLNDVYDEGGLQMNDYEVKVLQRLVTENILGKKSDTEIIEDDEFDLDFSNEINEDD